MSHAPTLREIATASHLRMDRANDSDASRELVAAKGMQACLPPRKNPNNPAPCDADLRKKRHQVENYSDKHRRSRGISTRHKMTADSFMAFVLVAI